MKYNPMTFKPMLMPPPGLEIYSSKRHLPLMVAIKIFRDRVKNKLINDSGFASTLHNKKFIFVRIPKNASTSLSGAIIGRENDVKWPSHVSAEYYRNIWTSFYKSALFFTAIRHPYDRLRSAFNYYKFKKNVPEERNFMDEHFLFCKDFNYFLAYLYNKKKLNLF
jgi:hypothetical protein